MRLQESVLFEIFTIKHIFYFNVSTLINKGSITKTLSYVICINPRYLKNNSSIDVPARDEQIKNFLAEGVSRGQIVKKGRFKYALPPKKVTVKKRKRAKKTFLKPKPKKRKIISRK